MRVLLTPALVLSAAATALAYGHPALTANVAAAAQATAGTSEPAMLLLSGSLLMGLAGALKKFC